PPEAPPRPVDHLAHLGPFRHVGPDREGAPRGALDEARGLAGARLVEIGDRDRRAGLGQAKGDGPADAGAGAGEERERARRIRPSYSITWSARTISERGIVRPSAFAVLRLVTSSNWVGCSIGRSAGLAPLRIRSA